MIILTGGAGFIGSCFLAKLNQEKIDDVIIVDSLDESVKWRNLVGKKYLDYYDKDDFIERIKENRFPKASYIIHMGACSSTTLQDADYFIKNNYEYSKTLADWALNRKIPFLYASSAATYGNGEAGFSDDIEATYRLKPLNMYGYSKHMFDLWLLNNKLIDQVTGLKFFNVFGPNEYHKADMRSLVCKRYLDLKEKGVMRLFKSYHPGFKDGEQKRDFIYIKDTVKIMYYLFSNRQHTGIYNVGTGIAQTWNDLAKAMFLALDKPVKIKYIDMPEILREKYQYFTKANIDKLLNLGLKTEFTSLEDSVKDYIYYLDKNKYI